MKSFVQYMAEMSKHKAEQTKLGHKFVTKNLVPKKITTLTFDKDIGGTNIKRQVEKWLSGRAKKQHKLEPKQVKYLIRLMAAIRRVPKNGSINVGPPPFSSKDVKTIAKDYSEILGCIWCTTKHYEQGVGKVNIPSSENLPLADILVPSGKKLRPYNLVSVKTKSGSPTSFDAIWRLANKNGFLRNKNFNNHQ